MDLAELSLPEIDKVLKTYPWFSLARKEFYLRMVSLGEEYRQEGLKRASVYVFSREGLLKEGQKIKVATGKTEHVEVKHDVEDVVFSLDNPELVETPVAVPEVHEVSTPVISLDEDVENIEEKIQAPVIPPAPTFSIDSPEPDIVEREPVIVPTIVPQPKKEIHVIGGDYFSKEDFETLQSDGMSTLERFSTMSRPDEGPSDRPLEDPNAEFTDEDYYTETLARIYSGQGLYKKAIEVYSKLILLYPEKSTYFAALIDEQKKYL